MHGPPVLPDLSAVEQYYTAKLAEHGATPQGVDWNAADSQELRFRQLLKICDGPEPFSINDIGCGYGALVSTLERLGVEFAYRGYDISRAMVAEARATVGAADRCRFVDSVDELEAADYSVASGIFNVKLDASMEAWRCHVLATLDRMSELSKRGFAFNVLTSYSDPERQRPDLYYADPLFFFDHCKRRHSPHVALLHDYGLWEFTLLVRAGPSV